MAPDVFPSSDVQKSAKPKVFLFLVLVTIFSSVFYYLIISSQSLEIYVLPLMWSQALAGLIVLLVFDRSIRGVGWRPGKVRYLAAAVVIPFIYWLAVYGAIWVFGWGEFAGFSEFTGLLTVALPGIGLFIIFWTRRAAVEGDQRTPGPLETVSQSA